MFPYTKKHLASVDCLGVCGSTSGGASATSDTASLLSTHNYEHAKGNGRVQGNSFASTTTITTWIRKNLSKLSITFPVTLQCESTPIHVLRHPGGHIKGNGYFTLGILPIDSGDIKEGIEEHWVGQLISRGRRADGRPKYVLIPLSWKGVDRVLYPLGPVSGEQSHNTTPPQPCTSESEEDDIQVDFQEAIETVSGAEEESSTLHKQFTSTECPTECQAHSTASNDNFKILWECKLVLGHQHSWGKTTSMREKRVHLRLIRRIKPQNA